jgi:glycosyltransferase involved in cell wall biosynthesis
VERVAIFLPDVVGGVSSVINNLLEFVPERQTTNVIAYSDSSIQRKKIDGVNEKAAFSRFVYDSRDNIYFTARRMLGLAPAGLTCLIATDLPELRMVQCMRVAKPVVFIVMGDFKHYYDTAILHEGVIDTFIAISKEIYAKLFDLLPHRRKDIRLVYFPTPRVTVKRAGTDSPVIKIIYVSRLEEGKNPLMLPRIDGFLKENGIRVEWTVVGDGPLRPELEAGIGDADNFTLTGFLSSKELGQAYTRQDIFLLPSAYEGIPVSLIEAMKTGLVPIVSDITGGIREIVGNGVNGYLCPLDDANAFARCVQQLHDNRSLYEGLASNALQLADRLFDPVGCSGEYWNIIKETAGTTRPKTYHPAKTGFLDKDWMPNKLVRLLRNVR